MFKLKHFKAWSAAALLAAMALLAALPAGAEGPVFKHEVSIYTDDKDGGLKRPEGVACNDKGVVIVADTGNGRLLRYTYQDGALAGGTEMKPAQVVYPIRVQLDSKDNILALDGKLRKIIRLSPKGEFLDYVDPKDAPGPANIVPRSFKLDGRDNIYLLDIASWRVLLLDPSGKFIKQVDLPQTGGFFSDICVDSGGGIFAVDSVSAAVYLAAKDAGAFTPLTKSLKDYMNFPTYITADNKGTLYLVDTDGGGIILLGVDGSFKGRQLGLGWSEGLLYYPSQMCMDGKGEAFIADRYNSRVQIFTTVK